MGQELKLVVDAARKGRPHETRMGILLAELKDLREALEENFSSIPLDRISDTLLAQVAREVGELLGVISELIDLFQKYLEVRDVNVLNPADLLIQNLDYKATSLDNMVKGLLRTKRE